MYLESIQRAVNRRNIKYNSCIDTTRDYVIILTQPFEIKQDVVCKDIINREFDLVKEYLSQKRCRCIYKIPST